MSFKSRLGQAFPIQVITLIHSNILNLRILDPDSSTLFLHDTNRDCFVCKAHIHAESDYSFCYHCSCSFHTSCPPLNNNIRCVNCNQQSSIIPVPMVGNHRNFYHVLIHLGLYVRKIPAINLHTNPRLRPNQRHPPRPIRRNQPLYPPLPLPPPPPPALPLPSNIHIIPNSPSTTPTTNSEQKPVIARHV